MLIIGCSVLLLTINFSTILALPTNDNAWKGNWFPASPDELDLNTGVNESHLNTFHDTVFDDDGKLISSLHDDKHGIKMGIPNSRCDDGKTNLTIDWSGSPDDYTCFNLRSEYKPSVNINPISSCDHIPSSYWALHQCMNDTIEYDDPIPTFGTHRPLWARFGEYRYLPKQRWLHNLEHGAVVMLYHPCADRSQVNRLKRVVKRCLYKHVITPYDQLDSRRPLALLTWGCRITMSMVDVNVVTSFIKAHALKGPEKISRDGQYDVELIVPAEIVSDRLDKGLCSNIRK